MPITTPNLAGVCRFCGGTNVSTIDSRPGEHPGWRRRRRKCLTCDKRWTSMELPIEDIERMLKITTVLDDLSAIALKVHTEIVALKSLKDDDEPEQIAATSRERNVIEERTLQDMSVP